jgi:predicted nucleotidyltransferase
MHIAPSQQSRIADICQRYHVRRLQLFGSAAVGQERPDSDVDLLVELSLGSPSGFALVDMQDELSAAFNGRKIDLAFPSVLDNPYRRRAIEPQLRLVPVTMDRTPAHLADMLRFTQELRSLANGHTLETFTSNRVLCLAVEKLFINLGEAAYRVDSESASQWPDIPWRRVIGLRNIWPMATSRWHTKFCSKPSRTICRHWNMPSPRPWNAPNCAMVSNSCYFLYSF